MLKRPRTHLSSEGKKSSYNRSQGSIEKPPQSVMEWYKTNIVGSSIQTTNQSYSLLQKTLRDQLISKKFQTSKILVHAESNLNEGIVSTHTLEDKDLALSGFASAELLPNNSGSMGFNWLTGSKFITNSNIRKSKKRLEIFKNSVLGSKQPNKNITITNKKEKA